MESEVQHCVVFTEVHSKPVRPVLVIIHFCIVCHFIKKTAILLSDFKMCKQNIFLVLYMCFLV